MGEYFLRGGSRLSGELRIGGSKNAALPILAAAVLNGSESVIHNCPRIRDTEISLRILDSLGCKTAMEEHTTIIKASADKWVVPPSLSGEMRSSICFAGCLLGRFGKVDISYPGGCEFFCGTEAIGPARMYHGARSPHDGP